jgi:GntR family transcriptional repressor for pyruvate dehydrogenase complex
VTDLAAGLGEPSSLDAVFAPVQSQTAFEETVDRLGTAIKLGLLPPGERLPAERELCARLGIARSTLRQALTALGQSGHLHAVRGRGGGTFVAEPPPDAAPPNPVLVAEWRDVCDHRFALEVGVAVLAATHAVAAALEGLDALVVAMDDAVDDYPTYRAADVRFHIGLAEATGSTRLGAAVTEAQSQMGDLIAHIAHPREVLEHANAQHARLLAAVRARDAGHAASVMTEHVQGTEHVLAGLLPGG